MTGRGTLTRGAIVEAAMAVLERDPGTTLSLRDVGEQLGVHPTAMYRHFRGKDELLRAVGDRILAGVTEGVDERTPWREAVATVCTRLRAAHLARPALATLNQSAPPRHDNERLVTESLLASFERGGFAPDDAAAAYHAVIELTIGSATIDAAMAAQPEAVRAEVYRRWRGDYAALDPERFPSSTRLASRLYAGSADDRFRFTLDRLLDGLDDARLGASPFSRTAGTA